MKASSNFYIVLALFSGIGLSEAQQATGNQSSIPAPTPYSIVANDANTRIWERTVYQEGPNGQIIAQKQRYTEAATGLNHFLSGKWVESKEEIDILPDGSAAATNGQHQVYFPTDIYNGEIMMVTPDGKVLQSQPLGLSYDDGTNTVLIATLTNSVGELVSSNQIVYPNAFVGITADLLFTYTKAGLEQDIIIRQQPPTPESFNLDSQNTRLQMLTEFFNPPQASVMEEQLPPQAGLSLNDSGLDFGAMQMIRGKAFLMGTDAHDSGAFVAKRWVNISGRQILIEEVPVMALANELRQLPQSSAKLVSPLNVVSIKRQLPQAHIAKTAPGKRIQIARATVPSKGVVMDYVTVNSQSGCTFEADDTYYISGSVDLSGTNTFEGGAVLKYAANASIVLEPTTNSVAIVWKGNQYLPVIFTAKDDNSVGSVISGSTGSPSGYYANPALEIDDANPANISGFRFAYAKQALYLNTVSGYDVENGQFVDCQGGFTPYDVSANLENVLFEDVETDVFNADYATINVQNATFSSNSYLTTITGTSQTFVPTFTNCVFVNVTNLTNNVSGPSLTYGLTGSYNGFYSSPNFGSSTFSSTSYPFQVVGGGNCYLTNTCSFLNVGTTNIDPVLLTNLAIRTVFPPIVYTSASFSTNITLNPQVQRDTNSSPDLGYHYDPLDYVFGGSDLYTNMNVTAGTAIGLYQAYGGVGSSGQPYSLSLNNGADFNAIGTPQSPCWITFADSVQEGCNGNWTGQGYMGGIMPDGGSPVPQLNTHFTKFFDSTWQACIVRDNGANGLCSFYDSEFYVANMQTYAMQNINFSNCLFFRTQIYFFDQDLNPNITIENCTWYGGITVLGRDANGNNYPASLFIVENTSFDGTAFAWSDPLNSNTNDTIVDYNAYNTNNLSWQSESYPYGSCYGTLQTVGPHTIYVTNYNWESSWFGNYYLPTNNPLMNAGSTTANLVGLYHFTIMTNQVIEGTNIVSIGYHYVATDTNGVPLDSNGDGIPDYLEDPLGNGLPYDGTNWALAILTQPASQSVIQTSNATFSVTAGGVTPIQYQWYSNSMAIANATNTAFTITNVQPTNAGPYYVIVTNNFGAITSSIATLTVLTLPTISITNPANNAVIVASLTNLTIMASVTDQAGIITNVQFFQGSTSLGFVTNSPYNFVWTNATTGSYPLTAAVIDNNGHNATSSVVNVFISPVFATNSLILWLEANAITGLANNASVSTWPDSSGWGYNATGSFGSEPSYVTNSLNGLPTVQFSGVNQYLNLPSFMTGATGLEAFVVLKAASQFPAQNRSLWNVNQGYPATDGSIREGFGSGNLYNLGVPVQPLTQYNIYEVMSQTNPWSAWINGILQYQVNNNWYYNSGSLQLGEMAYYSYYFAGNIAEIMVFNCGLSPSQRTTVNAYLNSKYGLVVAIPATPTNLVATAISPSQIGLTWSESLTNGSTQIVVERSTSSSGPFTTVAQMPDALSYVDTNLTAGTTYYYQLQAVNLTQLSPASNEAQATTPTTGVDIPLSSLILWLKADSGLLENGTNDAVNCWADQSGNGNSATQPTTGEQPLWVANALNGLPAVQFSGTNQYLNLPAFMNGATGLEAFVVLKVANAFPSNNCSLWSMGGNAWEYYPAVDGTIQENFGSGNDYNLGVPVQPLTQYHIFEVMSQTNLWSAWINGILQYQVATNNWYNYSGGPAIGAQLYGSNFFAGNIAEIMAFNAALTPSQRTTVNTYLNGKYGLVPAVPATPTNLVADAISPNQISLTWNETLNGGATEISVERSTNSSTGFSAVALVANADSYIDTNLLAATTYYYRVQANNLNIWTAYSNETNATTLTTGTNIPLSSLILWLKADSGLLEIGTNTSVNAWIDQSGNGNNATQPVAANQPTWEAGAIGTAPVMDFNGSSVFYLTNSASNPLANLTQAEAFVVLETIGQTNGGHSLWRIGNSDQYTSYPDTGGNILDDFGNATPINEGVPSQPLAQYHVYEVSMDTTNWISWINGVLLDETNDVPANFSPAPMLGGSTYLVNVDHIYIYQAPEFFAGNIAEVLIFNRALTVQERVAVGQYLISKYGLSQFAVNDSPPSTPTNFVAVGASPTQLNLAWFSTNATGIYLDRKIGPSGTYQEVASMIDVVTNFADATVYYTNQYFYKLFAENYFGQSQSIEISPPVVSLSISSPNAYDGYVVTGSTNSLIAQALDADSTVDGSQIINANATNIILATTSSLPYTNTWSPSSPVSYSFFASATDSKGNSWFSPTLTVPVYLCSNTNGIPNFLLVEQGNNPLNPWIAPSGDTNTSPPTINLVVPANATLLP